MSLTGEFKRLLQLDEAVYNHNQQKPEENITDTDLRIFKLIDNITQGGKKPNRIKEPRYQKTSEGD